MTAFDNADPPADRNGLPVSLHAGGSEIKGLISSPITRAVEIDGLWAAGLLGQDDETWNWRGLVVEYPHGERWNQYQLVALDLPQGAMIVCREADMRSADNTGQQGVYLEFLAAAPWNRKDPQGNRVDTGQERVTPVGQRLIEVAVDLSIKLGHEGRMGWHSKSGAESWYKGMFPGLIDMGPDLEVDNLSYFEISTDDADELFDRL